MHRDSDITSWAHQETSSDEPVAETESKKIVYTIGHDHVSQTTFVSGGPAEGVTFVFHMDGHGSTRVLTDLAGSIAAAAAPQIFHFTAYGKAINFTMSEAATSYLYSGEQFDSRIGQQYLRARYYDAATGTFNRLDPFFGNQTDSQSFHKYLYTHADPVNGVDPTGLFSVSTSFSGIGIGSLLAATSIGAVIGAGTFAGLSEDDYLLDDALEGALVGGSIGFALRIAAARKQLTKTIINGVVAGLIDVGVTVFLNWVTGAEQPTVKGGIKRFIYGFQSGVVGTALAAKFGDTQIGTLKSAGALSSLTGLTRSAKFLADPTSDRSFIGYAETVLAPAIASTVIGLLVGARLDAGALGGGFDDAFDGWTAQRQALKRARGYASNLAPAAQRSVQNQLKRLADGNSIATNELVREMSGLMVSKFFRGLIGKSISLLPKSAIDIVKDM